MKEHGKKRRPDLVGLREGSEPDPVPPVAAKKTEEMIDLWQGHHEKLSDQCGASSQRGR
jgi:hypothetical protein